MINVPLGDQAAIRAVAYHTEYGGFVDALGPGGGDNVNGGHRTGGRIALRYEPADGISITPRVLYQQIRANGFNRQEVYNLYANPFTNAAAPGGRAPVTFDERQQYLLLRERFEDDTFLADLTVAADLGAGDADLGHHLHQPRHPGQPRRQRAHRLGLGRSRLSHRGGAAAVQPGRHHRS